jgi:hydroxymethylglutaryl-CoA lyase
MDTETVKLIECPRDAWQGLPRLIPAAEKAAYLRLLLESGFRHIDAVSFVSPQHVKQMADSEQVLELLQNKLSPGDGPPAGGARPEIIGIVVNEQGMERAMAARGVTTIGYPYSISAYFRRANANMSRTESRNLVELLRKATKEAGRDLVVYISMAFGNPYEEPWGPEIVEDALVWLKDIGVRTVSLADTVGTATPAEVGTLFTAVKDCVAGVELGVHLHSRPEGSAEKIMAAYNAGCRRFDSALSGLGGCPFAGDDLVGNIATETVIRTFAENRIETGLTLAALTPALVQSNEIRERYSHPEPNGKSSGRPN